jgi:hypothetical protein
MNNENCLNNDWFCKNMHLPIFLRKIKIIDVTKNIQKYKYSPYYKNIRKL